MSYVVGLTGGIGSGKSAVANAFAGLGVEIADADVAAHAISAREAPGYAAVVAAFGPGVLGPGGDLDRAALRRRVFGDDDARKRLEAILHPFIAARLRADVAAFTGPYGLVVVPLLLERGNARRLAQRVLVVDCPEDEQVRRVMARSHLTAAEVRAIMATQLGRDERLAQADDVLDNSGLPAAIEPQVARLHRRYLDLARTLRS